MDAVVWNVFYPCDARAATYGSAWIDQSYKASVSGISKFTGLSKLAVGPVIWLYGMRLQMPVYQNASLLQHEDGRPWRLVIFSHGLAGSKTIQFCSELASRLRCVSCRRDRSGMLVTSRAGDHMLYLDQPDTTEFLFRVEQLEFRRLEVYEIFKAFRDVVSGDATGVHHLNGGPIDATVWRGRVQCDKDVVLAGHSFGGLHLCCLCFRTLHQEHMTPFPYSHALALDPWFQPLSTPGPMPSSFNTNIPLCMMFSERFALWKDHHATAKALVDSWPAKASMFALPKCSHETFSDVYCIVPFLERP
ncbi:platelet-activating factor acetylhydrolase [Auriculariales sp. MPI-PUGE-AT-0066]|nr:platelet-activating factor acetylhydrolase [Auriculariales sp. MPI-PUGE-AT-0066]